jgi:hypothetical protein
MPKSAKKSASSRPSKNTKSKPASREVAKALRPNTKSHVIIQLLGRETGATVKELAAAADWQEHSVRGFMSGTLKKRLGFDVSSEIVNGVRHYKVSGAGK